MKILSMTATFGKLDHATLTLKQGLEIIEAPNEWGKSTWCAFVVAMLYGISTSSRKKTDFLPDKERYAPWCGKPMSGRMEILWNEKNITIERSPKGKIPFGNFRAYETESGVEITGLTGENCGQLLLGVEREVFTRAGFLRGSELPVGEDEALRRRLNALVTTGDESGASDDLAQKLKNLKNECRHNKTGRIPQAEAQRDALEEKLLQMDRLKEQIGILRQREEALAEDTRKLKNHQVALEHEKALQTRAHVERIERAVADAAAAANAAEEVCRELPTQQTAEKELQRLSQVQSQWAQLQTEEAQLPAEPQPVQPPAPFAGKTPKEALQQAKSDGDAYKMLCKPATPWLYVAALVAVGAGVGMLFIKPLISLPFLVIAAVLLLLFYKNKKKQEADRQAVAAVYGNEDPDSWLALAQEHAAQTAAYEAAMATHRSRTEQLQAREAGLKQSMELLTQGKTLPEALEYWQKVLSLRQEQQEKLRSLEQARANARTVGALVYNAPAPEESDTLTLTEGQTEQALLQTQFEQKQLHQRLGQYEGQMETLGDRGAMEQGLARVQERLRKLEEYNGALTMALETLNQATLELQRRFAPRISARARELFSRLTGGRYGQLTLASDFSMEVAAEDEDMPHGVLWRSDGTADQLYLALRLAVAEELTPHAPLVLDDAFVRFDDTRLAAAMEILQEYAENKQVILFTCQSREKRYER